VGQWNYCIISCKPIQLSVCHVFLLFPITVPFLDDLWYLPYVAVQIEISVPLGGNEASHINRKHIADIFCIFYHIPSYITKKTIFHGNLCHYIRNYMDILYSYQSVWNTTSYIMAKLRHPKHAIVLHATYLAPFCWKMCQS
jgi:hypothetical protein